MRLSLQKFLRKILGSSCFFGSETQCVNIFWRTVIKTLVVDGIDPHHSGQISIIPKPELRGFWGSSLIKPPFRVPSADVVIICPDHSVIKETLGLWVEAY